MEERNDFRILQPRSPNVSSDLTNRNPPTLQPLPFRLVDVFVEHIHVAAGRMEYSSK